jgi:hypothetical protein
MARGFAGAGDAPQPETEVYELRPFVRDRVRARGRRL